MQRVNKSSSNLRMAESDDIVILVVEAKGVNVAVP